jgi:protease II
MNGLKMNKIKSLLFLACVSVIPFAGCAEQQQFKGIEQISIANQDVQKVMQAAEDVLGKMHFTIAKADVEQGLIRTRPLPGSQFFEFWRSDNVGSFNFSEANLHSLRRTVELDITQEQGQISVACKTKTERLNIPQRDVTSTSQVYRMFTESSSSMQRLELTSEQKKSMAWVNLGRDKRLETEILNRINKQITVQQKGQR